MYVYQRTFTQTKPLEYGIHVLHISSVVPLYIRHAILDVFITLNMQSSEILQQGQTTTKNFVFRVDFLHKWSGVIRDG